MPNALPRSFGVVNVVVSSDSAEGTSSAAKAPWQARAVTSMAKLTDAPPMADTPAKPARPVRKVTFRPSRSASRRGLRRGEVGGKPTVGDHVGQLRRVGAQIVVIDEGVVLLHVRIGVADEAWRRHRFHVGTPGTARRGHAVHDKVGGLLEAVGAVGGDAEG